MCISHANYQDFLFCDTFSYYLSQGGYLIAVVCLSLNNYAQKLPNRFARNFQGMMATDQLTNY